MAFNNSAPKQITWVICLVLYIVALAAAFGGVSMDATYAVWAWVIGFGLLLVATAVKDLQPIERSVVRVPADGSGTPFVVTGQSFGLMGVSPAPVPASRTACESVSLPRASAVV